MTRNLVTIITSFKPAQKFVRGLYQPSIISTSLAVTVCGLLLLSSVVFVDEGLMRSEKHRYFAHSSYDFSTFVSSRALGLTEDQSPSKVVVVGASSLRVAIKEKTLSSILGPSLPVFELCTGAQTFSDTATLLDIIPDGSYGIVVIGVGPGRFAQSTELLASRAITPALAIRTSFLDNELIRIDETPPSRSTNYFLDNRHYFLTRYRFVYRNLLVGPPTEKFKQLGSTPLKEKENQERSLKVSQRYKESDLYHDFNSSMLKRVIDKLKNRTKMEVALLETLMKESFVADYLGEDFLHEHKKRNRQFANDLGISYWDIGDAIEFSEDDFYDYTHLRSHDAANKFTSELASLILRFGGDSMHGGRTVNGALYAPSN